jgi:hypothetical protein
MFQSAPQEKPVASPRGAPVDGEVTLTMAGLPPLESVRIGFGSFHQNQGVGRAQADQEGRFTTSIRVPSWAEPDQVHFFFVSTTNQAPRILSEPFHVTGPDGTARVTGTISTVPGGSCVELAGPDGTLYALRGDLGVLNPGMRVQVVGTVGAEPGCSGQGLPIAVNEIRRA